MEDEDEEDAGYGADCAENTGTLEAAEEATDNRSGQRGGTSYEIADFDSEEAQRNDENSSKGSSQQADGGNRGGRTRDLDGTTDYETQNGTQTCPRNCAEQGPENETAHEPHQTLAGDDAHEAKSAGNRGRDFVLVVQLGCNNCIATF